MIAPTTEFSTAAMFAYSTFITSRGGESNLMREELQLEMHGSYWQVLPAIHMYKACLYTCILLLYQFLQW